MAKTNFTLGDGSATVFDIDCGFSTEHALVRVFDDSHDGLEVPVYQVERGVPGPTSLRFTFKPAPPVDALRVRVSDGTEKP